MPKGDKSNHPNGHYKCTDAEKSIRVSKVATWLIENPNARWVDCINWTKAAFGVEMDCANSYRKEAFKKIATEQGDDEFNATRKFAIIALQKQWRQAMDGNDPKLAFYIQQEINKVQGLYTHKVQIEDVSEKPIFNLGTDEVDSNDSN